MENLEIIFWLSAILQVIILICFFALCGNVSKIKRVVTPSGNPPTPQTAFSLYLSTGDVEKAKAVLMEIILSEPHVQMCIGRDVDGLQNVLKRYDRQMKAVGLDIDAKKAVDVKNWF